MKSPDTFLQIASGSLDNDSIVKNVFPSNLGITEKKILFWSTFNNELRIRDTWYQILLNKRVRNVKLKISGTIDQAISAF